MTNKNCPVCMDVIWANGTPTPYTEDYDTEVIGTLSFCSEECKQEYKTNE